MNRNPVIPELLRCGLEQIAECGPIVSIQTSLARVRLDPPLLPRCPALARNPMHRETVVALDAIGKLPHNNHIKIM